MIYNPQNADNKRLVDATGNYIPYVCEYNDETDEVTFYLMNDKRAIVSDEKEEGALFKMVPVKVTTIIKGVKLVDKGEIK